MLSPRDAGYYIYLHGVSSKRAKPQRLLLRCRPLKSNAFDQRAHLFTKSTLHYDACMYEIMPKTWLSRWIAQTSSVWSSILLRVVQYSVERRRRINNPRAGIRMFLLKGSIRGLDLIVPVGC